jgi:RNA polymerase sigma-70 factor (ECF subfamily)
MAGVKMHAQFDDFDAMTRIAAQDQQALRALYQHYGKAVYSLAYYILQNAVLAEEVTQDTFLKVWQKKNEWDPAKGNLKNWLLAIAHFTAIDRLRKEKRQPLLHPEALDEIADGHLPIEPTSWQDDVSLRLLVEKLPQEQAELIELAFFRGMTHSDIAETTRIPLGTIKTRLRAGILKLRELWLEAAKQTSKLP